MQGPPEAKRPATTSDTSADGRSASGEHHESNPGGAGTANAAQVNQAQTEADEEDESDIAIQDSAETADEDCDSQYACAHCEKIFGSHVALGGHVKGAHPGMSITY